MTRESVLGRTDSMAPLTGVVWVVLVDKSVVNQRKMLR